MPRRPRVGFSMRPKAKAQIVHPTAGCHQRVLVKIIAVAAQGPDFLYLEAAGMQQSRQCRRGKEPQMRRRAHPRPPLTGYASAEAGDVGHAQPQHATGLEERGKAKQLLLGIPNVLENVPPDRSIETPVGQRYIGEVAVEYRKAEVFLRMRRRCGR